MLNVLMQNRVDAYDHPGGDTVAMSCLKEHLTRQGVRVDVSLDLEPDCSGYDVVNLFNIVRVHETYVQFRNAARQKKKIVLMPIFWDFSELDRKGRGLRTRFLKLAFGGNGFELLKNAVRFAKDPRQRKAIRCHFIKSYAAKQRSLLRSVDAVTPNSRKEADLLQNRFGRFNCHVVPNGVDPDLILKASSEEFIRNYRVPYKKFGVCVGRFDERKNQLGLIQALKTASIPVVFIGAPGPNYRSYHERCRQEAYGGMFLFLPGMPQSELASAYAAAHMHVQASWLETPGLTNLEAGLSGCNLILSDRGSVREYFGDFAWYCDPGVPSSVRTAGTSAFDAPRGCHTQLSERILKKYTWERSAMALHQVYRDIVGNT
jgi:glycosyltransferase involved in cell wall biosynthesis